MRVGICSAKGIILRYLWWRLSYIDLGLRESIEVWREFKGNKGFHDRALQQNFFIQRLHIYIKHPK